MRPLVARVLPLALALVLGAPLAAPAAGKLTIGIGSIPNTVRYTSSSLFSTACTASVSNASWRLTFDK